MSLANSLKRTRMRSFFTQGELAKELNVTLSTVNRWETGKVSSKFNYDESSLKNFVRNMNVPTTILRKNG